MTTPCHGDQAHDLSDTLYDLKPTLWALQGLGEVLHPDHHLEGEARANLSFLVSLLTEHFSTLLEAAIKTEYEVRSRQRDHRSSRALLALPRPRKERSMDLSDLSALPPPVHNAILDLIEALRQTCAQAQPQTPQGESPPRFPRRPLELMILETLETIAPMPLTPVQMTVLINQPHDVVRDTLNALAVLGTIQHLRAGYYSHGPAVGDMPFRSRKKGGDRPPPPEVQLPSVQYAARIARIVAEGARRETITPETADAPAQEPPGEGPRGTGSS